MCSPEVLAHFHERCNVEFLQTFERPPLHSTSRLPSRCALRRCLTSRWLNVHFAAPRGHDERTEFRTYGISRAEFSLRNRYLK